MSIDMAMCLASRHKMQMPFGLTSIILLVAHIGRHPTKLNSTSRVKDACEFLGGARGACKFAGRLLLVLAGIVAIGSMQPMLELLSMEALAE